jgi:hypothetical protein
MNYFVNGQQVRLDQNNFVAKGGEGKIFQLGGVCYKIYEDPNKMIPEAKMKELQVFNDDNIIVPKDLIFDSNNKITGYTMEWLGDKMVALCKLFTNTFRDNNSVTNDHIIELVENMKSKICLVHSNKCLLVDGNEHNYLTATDWITPYFIDTNAWKTPSFPPTAIMPSIKDWQAKIYSELSDWFSFAIVSFQLFVGIHPFKGRVKGFKKGDFESRVKRNLSVLNPKVRVNAATRDFSLIPGHYMDWYFRMFEKGDRDMPPLTPGTAAIVPVKVILVQSTNSFEIIELREFDEDILFNSNIYGNEITKTKKNVFIHRTDYRVSPDVELVFAMPEMLPVFVKIEDDKAQFHSIKKDYEVRALTHTFTDKMIVNNTLFLINKGKINEITFSVFGKRIMPMVKNAWTIEQSSSQVLGGVIYQSVMGSSYLVIPITSQSEKSSLVKKAVPELDDYRIIDAKYMNHVCVIIGHKDGVYNRITIIFDLKHDKYKVHIVEDIDYEPINMTVLDNGVCVTITSDNAVEIFMNTPTKDDVKRIEDPDIDSTMQLCKDGTQLRFFKGNKLFSIKMK